MASVPKRRAEVIMGWSLKERLLSGAWLVKMREKKLTMRADEANIPLRVIIATPVVTTTAAAIPNHALLYAFCAACLVVTPTK